MTLRMSDCVFVDEQGVVHYRKFEPGTVCGVSCLRYHASTCEGEGRFSDGKCCNTNRTIHRRPSALVEVELPMVTCMLCLMDGEEPNWVGSTRIPDSCASSGSGPTASGSGSHRSPGT